MSQATGSTEAAPDDALLTRRILRFLALVGFVYVMRYLAMHGERSPTLSLLGPARFDQALLGLLVAGVGPVFLTGRWLRRWLAAVSIAALVFFLRKWGAGYVGYAVLIAGIGRLPIKLRYQLLLAALVWSALPIWKWHGGFPISQRAFFLSILWAQAAYGTAYLLIERARARKSKPQFVDDLVYLTILPRFIEPFFQPLSPKYLFAVEAPKAAWRQTGRAVGLGAYGLALSVSVQHLLPMKHHFDAVVPLAVAHSILLFYCAFAAQVFISMSLIRFLGYDVASGMKLPFLSRSFREFFRLWNHYIRDAVVSLFLFPLQGWLRKKFSPRVSRALAAYGAIIIGSLLLNDILVPTVTNFDMSQGIDDRASVRRLIIHLVYWSAIILPKSGLEVAAEKKRAGLLRRVYETVRFLLAFGGVWYLSQYLGEKLM